MEQFHSDDWPFALAREWVVQYNRYIFQVIALREVVRKGWQPGCLQDLITESAVKLVDTADQLRSLGHAPHRQFANEEASLWRRTVEYVCALPWRTAPSRAPLAVLMADAERVRAGWARFSEHVWGLADDCFAQIPALQPTAFDHNGLAGLLGERAREPGREQAFRQPFGEDPDQPLVLGTT
jgi:hypothetical protein